MDRQNVERRVIKAGGQKTKTKRWECIREERKRGVRLTGGWMVEDEVERKKRGKKRYEMKGMKAPKQRDELKQGSHHSCVLFFSVCST